MVPGWLSGTYSARDLSIDVVALCARAGATLLPFNVTAINAAARTVTLSDGQHVSFDVCSLAVGSKPSGLQLPGASQHAIPLKPLQNVERIISALDSPAVCERGVCVVGGGLAGVEMALAARARLCMQPDGASVPITIVTRDDTLFSSRGPRLREKLETACARANVHVVSNATPTEVREQSVRLADGTDVESALTIWSTGPAAQAWLAQSDLATDDAGYVLVNDALQSVSAPAVFSAGDCATLQSAPDTSKAGVYAVRMGPMLVRALRDALHGRAPAVRYAPQKRWLALVSTADGRAIASYGSLCVTAAWAMWLKDRIDRTFIARFRNAGV
jgi:pyridine nucleotide-disulfide oxidoreductase family protein